jgi:hypothetical protein
MSGVSYNTPEELFADLPGSYLYAVQIPGEAVWWSQKDLAQHAGCPKPRSKDARQHWTWLQNKFPGITRVKRPGKLSAGSATANPDLY